MLASLRHAESGYTAETPMLGIRGLDWIGLTHTLFALAALVFGGMIVAYRKGTARHRAVGRLYALSMVGVNLTAFLIYDLFGRFGPFHVAALISLATLMAGYIPVFLRRPRGDWVEIHGAFMAWSFVGLVAALVAESAVRVPGWRFGPAAISSTVIVFVLGGAVIHTRVPRIVRDIVRVNRAAIR